MIAEDANAKLGQDLIVGDPHTISDNGKLLAEMIDRKNLFIVNSSNKCEGGPITRYRDLTNKENSEASCIDFIIVSMDLAKELDSALIDSKQLYTLTKYTTTKGHPSVKRSDHYTLIANFTVKWVEKETERIEFFKLRDEEGLEKWNKITSKRTSLILCVQQNVPLEEACSNWYKEIRKLMFICFKKIRVTDKPPKKSIDFPIYQLMEKNKTLKKLLSSSSEMCRPALTAEIKNNESKIAVLQGENARM